MAFYLSNIKDSKTPMKLNQIENNKRIAKNTLLLYVRMIFTMIIGLFTSRIVLETLGVENYGVYNIVGGVVAMFSFLTSSLSTAVSRFITYELGKKDYTKLKLIFSSSVNTLIILSLIIIIIAEVLGGWFLNNKLNIPITKIEAANWVLHCSIITFGINLISVPYNATIIAHERMSAFAYISILEVSLKLLTAYCLYISPFDKLKTYSILLLFVALTIRTVYGIYCARNFSECKYKFTFNKEIIKQTSGFTTWHLLATGAQILNTQGVNIISNLFFGVTINAARGVATQVEALVKQFATNFTTAINPQIIKSYACNNKDYMFSLVCKSSKYSYFLLLVLIVPFIFEAENILRVWLKNVPEFSAIFLRLTLIGTSIDLLSNPIAISVLAQGKIKKYYIIISSIATLVLPFSYILFKLGLPAYTSYIVFICIYIILLYVKLHLVRRLLGFSIKIYTKNVIYKIIPVTICSLIIPGLMIWTMEQSLLNFLTIVACCILSTIICIYSLGLDVNEKELVKSKIESIISKIKKSHV